MEGIMKKLDPRSVIIGFLVAVIGFMSMGATNSTFESITVGEIKMKDGNLKISNSFGTPVLFVTGADDFNGVTFFTSAGKIGATIGQTDDGYGLISTYNANGTPATTLSGGMTGDVRIYNSEGTNTVSLSHSTGNQGVVSVNNNNGDNIIRLGGNLSGDASIILFNKHQKRVTGLGVTDEADGFILLSDRYGEAQWNMVGKRK
jgi:hypothetical protein